MSDIPAGSRPKIRMLTRVLSFAELFGAALLVGGLLAAGAIGALAFHGSILTHELAGRFMAEVFERSLAVEAVAAALLALGLLGRLRAWRALVALATVAIVAGHFVVGGRMHAIRASHGGTLEGLALDDPERVEFGKLHGVYALASIGLIACGVSVLVCAALRERE
jgi:hypothetical protein